jgi:ubiquinone/menaquinone biosynthesis C-methylase UbiE
MHADFQKDLSHLTWEQIYARQAQRTPLVADWMDALFLKSGDRVLEIGAGPGYVSLALARRIGASGLVYAVDRSADALASLQRRQAQLGIGQIERIVADAATLDPKGLDAGSALITMVLHHADEPAVIVRNVARFLPEGAPVVIGEFHPDGPCTSGPPREHRLRPGTIRAWCRSANLEVTEYRRQTPEHYMLAARREALCS